MAYCRQHEACAFGHFANAPRQYTHWYRTRRRFCARSSHALAYWLVCWLLNNANLRITSVNASNAKMPLAQALDIDALLPLHSLCAYIIADNSLPFEHFPPAARRLLFLHRNKWYGLCIAHNCWSFDCVSSFTRSQAVCSMDISRGQVNGFVLYSCIFHAITTLTDSWGSV